MWDHRRSYGQPTTVQHLTVSGGIVLLCVETPLQITPNSTVLDTAWNTGRRGCIHLSEYPSWNNVHRNTKKMGKLLKLKCWFMTASHNFESLLCMANLLKKTTNNWKTLWFGALALKFCFSVDIGCLNWCVCPVMYYIHALYSDNHNCC